MNGEPLPLSPPPIRVASTIALTEAEGPGPRFAIWTQGCTLACPECCNPHLWNAKGGVEWTAAALLAATGVSARAGPTRGGKLRAALSGAARDHRIIAAPHGMPPAS